MTPTDDPFPQNLRRLRTERGLTQHQLATLIGKRERDISRWELGDNDPEFASVRRIAVALDVQIDDLVAIGEDLDRGIAARRRRPRGTRRPSEERRRES